MQHKLLAVPESQESYGKQPFGERKFKECTVHGSSECGERVGDVEPNRVTWSERPLR